uniref:Uncharacterized protein LOC113796151 n=1 Tax=Dermatophagoides pteronyssinus TaxID=6956 RepID=A0A6P6YB45_DERPT|nr:uncharacterized protein LOC113796151 [Dermatophagoides pteronyssinus]
MSFADAFTKDTGHSNLEYDDNAFFYVTEKGIFGLENTSVYYLTENLQSDLNTYYLLKLISKIKEVKKIVSKVSKLQAEEIRKLVSIEKIISEVELKDDCDAIVAFCLFFIYLQRKKHLLSTDLQKILDSLLIISEVATKFALHLAFIHSWCDCVQTIIGLRKCIRQSVMISSYFLCQAPHIDEEKASNINEILLSEFGTKKMAHFNNFKELIHEFLINRDKYLKNLTEEQNNDIELFYKSLPTYVIRAEVFVEDEDDIAVGDIATISIMIKRNTAGNIVNSGYFHCPYYPEYIQERIYIFVSDKKNNSLYNCQQAIVTDKEYKINFNIPVTESNENNLTIAVFTDSYFANDKMLDVSFKAAPKEKLKRRSILHKDDLILDNENFVGSAWKLF